MLLLKGKLFAKVGKPEAGFSIAMRAASVAYKARLMPSLWQAVGLIANVLNALGEFAACERLLDAVIPQVRQSMWIMRGNVRTDGLVFRL
jgi:anaphase-promoting complex subunit 5